MQLAILSALAPEIGLLVEGLDSRKGDALAGWPIWHGIRGGRDVILAEAGLGKVNTAALTALIWERHRPDVFVFTGVAGALDPGLGIGDIVIGERSIQHDAGVVSPAGLEVYQPGHVPFLNPTDLLGYSPSGRLLETMTSVAAAAALSPVLERQPQVVLGTILTGDFFLEDPTTRDHLRSALDGKAIEMEGAAMAQVATRLGTDHLVVRAVSDLAGESAIEDFDRFITEVAANSARLVLGLIDRLQEHDRDHPVGA